MAATDHPLKRLVALAPEDFAAWLLGQPIRSVHLRQTELTAEPIDADLVMDVVSADGKALILHLEFQGTGTHRPMELRVLDYQTRFALTARNTPVVSVVIYLGGAGANDTGQHQLLDPQGQPYLTWRYIVVRLWQILAEDLLALERPALLALLGQTRMNQPDRIIPQAVAQIEQHTQGEQRERLLSELLLLCTNMEVAAMVEQLITHDYGLPETPMMRKLREQGRTQGRTEGREEGWWEGRKIGQEEGREEGREQGQEDVVVRQLTRRYGLLAPALLSQIQALSREQLLHLGEELLDFRSPDDLVQWLARL